ncbi:MBL fold metallo-hydrolase [Radiobacillus kanasensis]|uniref:MBL fold metallo-hydrolase n=1 Tax=Radiobacillus kanasensis TaxID=2844358 RepID=UPI0038B4B040
MENVFKDAIIPLASLMNGQRQDISEHVYGLQVQIVNVYFVRNRNTDDWVLIDAGMPRSDRAIIKHAAEIFGPNHSPKAIILTHGHFDHVGSITDLITYWDVPVYAHEQELDYLTGKASYPKGDAEVEGGLVSSLSPLFPNHGINLDNHVHPLPDDHSVPFLDDWEWIATPGHTDGHISLFRELDRTIIVGDAFCTVKQESLYNVITQKHEISGPPKYFTTDWEKAEKSVQKLRELEPHFACPGHGLPIHGEKLTADLQHLTAHFEKIAKPEHGKFVD